ncbi:putative F-box/LRR-repeat protein At4g00320 isoform X2 [Carex rostrata]
MANSSTDSDLIDRLSNLPDALLITIISFLPTHIAARTSVLCRRFRHLWEASPSLALNSYELPRPRSKTFIAMAKRALLGRNPSLPLHSLSLEAYDYGSQNAIAIVSSLIAKARSLDLHHLTMKGFWLSDFLPILPIVFTINSLRRLSLYGFRTPGQYTQKLNFPSGINLTFLRSLSLQWIGADVADLNKLLSELCSLEDLHLHIRGTPGFTLSSQTIRKLKLIFTESTQKLDIVGLSLPLLESLHLEIRYCLGNLSHIRAKVPLLTKAVIKLGYIREKNASTVDGLLNCISHVEELSLDLDESTFEEHPIPILLESRKDVPKFSNLKHLDMTLCFHEHNLAAVIMMLHICPLLESLKLVHEIYFQTGKKRKDWQSKLPRNADGNYRYAYFRNLHLEENRKEVIKLLSKKCSSKR